MPYNSGNALALAIAVTLSVAPPVFANGLEEVIIIACKREENLQQAPTATDVFTAHALKNRHIESLVDL